MNVPKVSISSIEECVSTNEECVWKNMPPVSRSLKTMWQLGSDEVVHKCGFFKKMKNKMKFKLMLSIINYFIHPGTKFIYNVCSKFELTDEGELYAKYKIVRTASITAVILISSNISFTFQIGNIRISF